MDISALMTTDVVSVNADAPIQAAACLMKAKNVGSVMVMKDGDLAGIVSDRDLAVRATAEGWDPAAHKVNEVMTPNPVTISSHADMMDASKIIGECKVRRLPVMEDGRVVGIISAADLADYLRQQLDAILLETSKAEH